MPELAELADALPEVELDELVEALDVALLPAEEVLPEARIEATDWLDLPGMEACATMPKTAVIANDALAKETVMCRKRRKAASRACGVKRSGWLLTH